MGYVDPTGHWPGWFEFIAGAAYQFSNDMTVGIPNAAFGADWQTDQSDAFRGGQEVGRAFSTAAGLALTVDGAAKIAAGISLIPPTAGVGAVCTGGTGGLCVIPAGVAIGIEGAVAGVGAAEAGYGGAVVLMAAKNPVGGGNQFKGPRAKGFDWDHIFERHSDWGNIAKQRTRGDHTIFENLTKEQIQARVQSAWKHRELMETQIDDYGVTRMRYRGVDPASSQTVDMWFNKDTGIVESAFPIHNP